MCIEYIVYGILGLIVLFLLIIRSITLDHDAEIYTYQDKKSDMCSCVYRVKVTKRKVGFLGVRNIEYDKMFYYKRDAIKYYRKYKKEG